MARRVVLAIVLGLAGLGVASAPLWAAAINESEPNNTAGTADSLGERDVCTGTINPTGDVDYYALSGINTGWGVIALLDTISSTGSTSGTIEMLRADGSTVLQSDTGSWERGSGIALQNWADGGATHYLRVSESGNDAVITPYTIRYYDTVVDTRAEVEPNDTRATGTPSSFTNAGTISGTSDVDCYAFQGRAGDTILLAVNGDPEDDGGSFDPVVQLISPSDAVMKTADSSGANGNEFIEYVGLATDDVYAYCVSDASGSGSPNFSYTAGIVRNGRTYFSDYSAGPTWYNEPVSHTVLVGESLVFHLNVSNTGPITIPGAVYITAYYSEVCLSVLGLDPSETSSSTGEISWDGLWEGLAPAEAINVTMTMRAETHCADNVHQSTYVEHFFTGSGGDADYKIVFPENVYVPLVLRTF